MNNAKNYIFMILLLLVPMIVPATDSNVTFNYSGLVRVNGTPFDGIGEFKLAIVTTNGNFTLWSNDSTSTNGSEPTEPILSTVSNGIFSINVGDVSEGMDPINRALFNNDTKKMRLRIWFSDGTNGFQSLLPQRKLDNIELLALTTGSSGLEIYVSESVGNDEFDGLTTDTAKATVQAGIDLIPAFVDSPVVVNILPGTYYETVDIYNIKFGSADGSLTIKGNESNLPVISGADVGTVNPIHDIVMIIDSSDRISLENLRIESGLVRGVMIKGSKPQFINCTFDNFKSPSSNETFCMESNSFSDVIVFGCTFQNSTNALRVSNKSRLGLFDSCIITNIDRYGALSFGASFLRIDESTLDDFGVGGVSVRDKSLLTMRETSVTNCIDYNIEVLDDSYAKIYACTITNGGNGGVKSSGSSHVQFLDLGLGDTFIDNCAIGMYAEYDSVLRDRNGAILFGTNTTNSLADSSSHLFDIP